jgi:hypothetical protein
MVLWPWHVPRLLDAREYSTVAVRDNAAFRCRWMFATGLIALIFGALSGTPGRICACDRHHEVAPQEHDVSAIGFGGQALSVFAREIGCCPPAPQEVPA